MKKPRFDAFPTTKNITSPNPIKELHSPLDDMPVIQPHQEIYQSPSEKTVQQDFVEIQKQSVKTKSKYSTFLSPESIRAMKVLAIEQGRNDYELFQEAVDNFLGKAKS